MPRLITLRPVTHDTAGPGIFRVIGVTVIAAPAIVATGVLKTDGMSQLMHSRQQKVTAQRWSTVSIRRTNIGRNIVEMFIRK